jgi:hypothetical protein
VRRGLAWTLLSLGLTLTPSAGGGAQTSPKLANDATVLLELFTSEGCSSCPPAEALVRALDHSQPLHGVRVLALEYHVDYWDDLGWKDPYSIPEASARQEGYARVLGRGVFTPELIAQGSRIVSGAERSRLSDWLPAAAPRGPARITLSRRGNHISLQASGLPPTRSPDSWDVFVVLSEAGLVSHVRAGENRGQTLRHAPVVRRIVHVGEPVSAELTWHGDLDVDPSWNAAALRVSAFVQNRRGRQIIAVADARE